MIKGPFIFTAIVSIFLLAFLMNTSANLFESQPSPPDQKFEVVDTYKGCEVVRYTPDNSARYTYFLDCSNKQN
jgi:uncharacterized iron-regulated protein